MLVWYKFSDIDIDYLIDLEYNNIEYLIYKKIIEKLKTLYVLFHYHTSSNILNKIKFILINEIDLFENNAWK